MHNADIKKRNSEEKKCLPLVSVIMPCYNHGAYVGNAIESILNQTYPNIELIVADNGCTDNSFEVINRYRDRIKMICLDKNDRRLCGEMLREAVTGEFIAQATADDEWMPQKIELQMQAFFSIPNLQVCFTWALYADENMEVCSNQDNNIFFAKNKTREEWLRNFFYRGNCLCYPSALYRTEIDKYFTQIVRGYAQLSDFYRWISVLQLGEIYVVEKPMVKFRWHISGENANESAPSMGNAIRSGREYVDIALRIAEDTEDDLFKKAFGEEFVNRDAQTHQELLCERFFLLKRRAEGVPVFSEAMLSFYYNHYGEMASILQGEYGFSFDHYRELVEQCGSMYAYVMLNLEQTINETQGDSLFAYRQMALKLTEKYYSEGRNREKAKDIFGLMPGSDREILKNLYEICQSILNWIFRHGQSLDMFYFDFMKLIGRANQLMNDMRLQLKLLGILLDDEEFELFEQLVHLGENQKIDLLEAIVPYIEMTAKQLAEILN